MLLEIICVFAFCFVLERFFPGWKLPRVASWAWRVVGINLVQIAVVVLAGLTWEQWFSAASVFRLSDEVGPIAGGLLAYFIATFVFYWWQIGRAHV